MKRFVDYLHRVKRLVFSLLLLGLFSCADDTPNMDQALSPPLQEVQFDALLKLYENEERDSWQLPHKVLQKLGNLSGKTVADLGAGSGYFSFRMLPLGAHVIAIEIDERFTRFLEKKAQVLPDSLRKRLDIRLATPVNPHLRPREADVILVVNTYIYIQDRIEYFRNLRTCLSDGGELLVVEYHKKPQKKGPPIEIKLASYQVAGELVEAGYEILEEDLYSLPFQYIIRAR